MKVRKTQDTKTNLEAARFDQFAESSALKAWRWFNIGQFAMKHFRDGKVAGAGTTFRLDAASEASIRLDALKYHEKAMLEMKASFFHELAKFLDFMNRGGVKHPVWFEFGAYMWKQQRLIEHGKRSALKKPITREEVWEHLNEQFPGKVGERNFTKMISRWGLPLVKKKPGPDATRKVRK